MCRRNVDTKWLSDEKPTAKQVSVTLAPARRRSAAWRSLTSSRYRCGGRPSSSENTRAKWYRLIPASRAIRVRDNGSA